MSTPRTQVFARIAFVAAALFALTMAALPHPPRLPGEPPDTILHMLAFATLGTLAAMGFRGRSTGALLVILAVFGGAIEVVQAIPALHRDSELGDWLIDIGAAFAALATTRRLLDRHDRRNAQPFEP